MLSTSGSLPRCLLSGCRKDIPPPDAPGPQAVLTLYHTLHSAHLCTCTHSLSELPVLGEPRGCVRASVQPKPWCGCVCLLAAPVPAGCDVVGPRSQASRM